MYKYLKKELKKYILIILSVFIFSQLTFSKSFSEENIFFVDNVKVEGEVNTNFSRKNYINRGFLDSFKILMSKILLSNDLNKIKNIKLNEIKKLIEKFQILEETYRNNEYTVTFKIYYNEDKIKEFLENKNISFAQPKKITAVFFPILFINNEIKNFNKNYFYQEWKNVEIENEIINFILPLDDLDDIYKINEMKNNIEELDINEFIKKYNEKNYVFTFMDYNNENLKIHIKTNFNDNKINKNINYKLLNLNETKRLNFILKDLKIQITDIWKKMNIVNLSMPLSIKIKFQHKNLLELNQLKVILSKIKVIDHFIMEEFDINHSIFKIYYYGNPKRLQKEMLEFKYLLKFNQSAWELYKND